MTKLEYHLRATGRFRRLIFEPCQMPARRELPSERGSVTRRNFAQQEVFAKIRTRIEGWMLRRLIEPRSAKILSYL